MIISHKQGRGNKIHLFLDNEYRITTNSDFWAENYIKDGTEIEDLEWDELVCKINYSKAVKKCYDLLSIRSHSEKELRDKLIKSFDANSVDMAIDLMLEYGYLNDEEYAKELLNHLVNNKKLSERFIIMEMKKRGISADIYNNLLCDADIDNIGVAYDIIVSKYINKLNEEGGRQKVIAALARRGFSYSDITSALDMIESNDEF